MNSYYHNQSTTDIVPMPALIFNHHPLTSIHTFDLGFPRGMADGMNQVRAMRLAEIVQEFRSLQHQIAQIQTAPSEEEKDGEGYKLLRECVEESQTILNAPFSASDGTPGGDAEKEREQLQSVMLDSSCRRFLAQRVYLRATAAMRWINGRNAILQDGTGTNDLAPALRAVSLALRTELSAITYQKVVSDLLINDQQQGKWTNEDPSLSQIQSFIRSQSMPD